MKVQIDLTLHQSDQLRALSKLLDNYADEVDELAQKQHEQREKFGANTAINACDMPIGGAYLG